MWEQAVQSFTEFAGLPEMLVDFHNTNAAGMSDLEWVTLLSAAEGVPKIHNVIELQEYIHTIGTGAQAELLAHSGGQGVIQIQRISDIVWLANTEVLNHNKFLEGDQESLEKYATEIKKVIRLELIYAKSGPALTT